VGLRHSYTEHLSEELIVLFASSEESFGYCPELLLSSSLDDLPEVRVGVHDWSTECAGNRHEVEVTQFVDRESRDRPLVKTDLVPFRPSGFLAKVFDKIPVLGHRRLATVCQPINGSALFVNVQFVEPVRIQGFLRGSGSRFE
jgi:hypothetical protein